MGVFAALNQIEIAPAIVNGLFYAILAVIAGSAIIAIGGGGITPMRAKWEQALNRVDQEAPAIKSEAANTSKEDLKAHAEQRRAQAESAGDGSDTSTGATRAPGSPTISLPEEETTRRTY